MGFRRVQRLSNSKDPLPVCPGRTRAVPKATRLIPENKVCYICL